jgi:hypothetical protein
MSPKTIDRAIRLAFRSIHDWRNRRDLALERRQAWIAYQMQIIEVLLQECGGDARPSRAPAALTMRLRDFADPAD